MSPGPNILWTSIAAPMICCVSSSWINFLPVANLSFGIILYSSFRLTFILEVFFSASPRLRGAMVLVLCLQNSHFELLHLRVQRSRLQSRDQRLACFQWVDDFVDP